jgi:hypothetical protein
VFATINAALGGDDGTTPNYRFESKKRGMSDVDDTNIRQLQDNTSNMIQQQLTRMISQKQSDNA